MMDKIMFSPALEYALDVVEELECEPADVVVTSEMLTGVMAACESRGQRLAVLAANLCLFPLPGMHKGHIRSCSADLLSRQRGILDF